MAQEALTLPGIKNSKVKRIATETYGENMSLEDLVVEGEITLNRLEFIAKYSDYLYDVDRLNNASLLSYLKILLWNATRLLLSPITLIGIAIVIVFYAFTKDLMTQSQEIAFFVSSFCLIVVFLHRRHTIAKKRAQRAGMLAYMLSEELGDAESVLKRKRMLLAQIDYEEVS
jgi:hypothetical protein